MSEKLSPAQQSQLEFLATTDVGDITDERVVKALARRGLAERYVEILGHLNAQHRWRITPAGRARLAGTQINR